MNLTELNDVFEVKYGNSLALNAMTLSDNGIPFVSRQDKNNGVVARVEEIKGVTPNPPNSLSVAASGSVLATFYQPEPYYSAFHVFCLVPKIEMSVVDLLLYSKFINFNKYKYSYGRQANKTLKELLIPDRTEVNVVSGRVAMLEQPSNDSYIDGNFVLSTQIWKDYECSELFDVKGTKTTSKLELEKYGKGRHPYVTTKAKNNGVEDFYNFYTENGNVLTIDSAAVGYCSYQNSSFSASDHVEVLVPKNFHMNVYIAMFLVTIFNKEQYRYNYGRKCSQRRIENFEIKLPTNSQEKPDWQFMENYIKSLQHSANL